MSADDVLRRAACIIFQNETVHGNKSDNFKNIALLWNVILEVAGAPTLRPLDGHDVCTMMEGLKIARRFSGAVNIDDYIDSAGYAACALEVRLSDLPPG